MDEERLVGVVSVEGVAPSACVVGEIKGSQADPGTGSGVVSAALGAPGVVG
eukprot:evm.model.NODE_8496_length_9273_cov_24.198210.3